MKKILLFLFILSVRPEAVFCQTTHAGQGFEKKIRKYIDTLSVFDTHEHFMDPEMIKKAGFLDFSLLLLENGYDDLVSAGLNDSLFSSIFSPSLSPAQKWNLIEPYWKKASNTANNRILLRAIHDLYDIDGLNSSTAEELSIKMRQSCCAEWFDQIIRKKCRIDNVIIDGKRFNENPAFIHYSQRFYPWISICSRHVIDSISAVQGEPVSTLESFVKSLSNAVDKAVRNGAVLIKINIAYQRPLNFEKVTPETAKKVFKTIINQDEDTRMPFSYVKPLQDYIVYQLIGFAEKYKLPVAFHTGFQAGNGNIISNSNPSLLAPLILDFPNVNFVLYHGSYPFGGELSTMAKNFRNVYLDMNWTYDISPYYAERNLNEWLETVPANKIMAFGGDQRMPEMTYGSLVVAKDVISRVLRRKVSERYFTEAEAQNIARMILHDNGMEFFHLK